MSAATGTTTPLNKIERAHQMYRDGRHEEALGFYTEALSMAKTKAQKIALHSNRAACYLKLHRFNKAAEECTLVLELDQNHTGALMLRAQTLVTLKDYHAALFDVNRLIELNPSSDVYQNLHARLKTQLLLAPIPECEEESLVSELEEEEEYEHQVEDEEEEEDEEEPEQQKQEVVALAEQEIEVPRTIPIARASVSQAVVALPDQKPEVPKTTPVARAPVVALADQKPEVPKTTPVARAPVVALADQKTEVPRNIPISRAPISSQTQSIKNLSDLHSKGHKEIPKPKGHSKLDYSRWDQVEDDSSEEEDDDDEESLPQYRFRVRTVGVRPVK